MLRAQKAIVEFVSAVRELDAADRDFRERNRVRRAEAKRIVESELIDAAKSMGRADRLWAAANFYWGAPDVGGAKAVLNSLGFHIPTGFPREGVPILLVDETCHACGGQMLKKSRVAGPFCRRYCTATWRDVGDTCAHLEEYIGSRGLVRFDEHGLLQWVEDAAR